MNKFLIAKATNCSSSSYKFQCSLIALHVYRVPYLFQSYEDLIGFYHKSINFCIPPIPEFSKSAS